MHEKDKNLSQVQQIASPPSVPSADLKSDSSAPSYRFDEEIGNSASSKEEDLSNIDDDGREPTAEESKLLRHVPARIPYIAWLVAIVELAERFSYYGLSAPFQNYMQNGPHDKPAGMLDLNQSGATAISYVFQFWCYLSPLIGGYVADTFWGKYNTILVACVIYIVGELILFITSIPSITNKSVGTGGFAAAIAIIGLATGMVKSNVAPLIADQIPKTRPTIKILKSGERVIVDPSLTIQRIYATFYMMINIGSLSVIATTELEAHVGFWAAYLLPFCFFFVGLFALIIGKKHYVKVPIGDKIINKAVKCIWIAVTSGFSFSKAKPSLNLEKQFTWNDQFVEEVKRALYACKVFAFYPIYWLVYGQMVNNFVSQAASMRSHGLPNDFLQVFDSIAVIVFVPIMEKLVYPFVRRWTPLRPITRIYFGFMFATGSMVYAAVLQHYIYKAGPCYDDPRSCPEGNNVHIALQTPAYWLIAMSEIMASITGLEYAYTKAPLSMKSFVSALFLVTNAIGAALGIALSPVSKDPKMVWQYTGLAVSCFIAGTLFWFIYRSYNAREESWNDLEFNEVDDMLLSPVGSICSATKKAN
ncbi:uncharacterized protein LODBEIA_P21860 [Lodderomyces beijingensis]|uniref:Peptide transporter PTR2 n=1 Tax=Lodderomyces beijingensis TaxID=1775926 RepID=A0ABP0ZII3_9ASCO